MWYVYENATKKYLIGAYEKCGKAKEVKAKYGNDAIMEYVFERFTEEDKRFAYYGEYEYDD